jgi:uncharacterized protein
MQSSKRIIEQLQLAGHPEGGHYRRTYESESTLANGRQTCTAIYFLLANDDFSALHRISSDELWHYYGGAPMLVVVVDGADGSIRRHRVGPLLVDERGRIVQQPQLVVHANQWFGSRALIDDTLGTIDNTVGTCVHDSGSSSSSSSASSSPSTSTDCDYSLVGCTVSPGFSFDDWQLADRKQLSESFPQHKKFIEQWTRSNKQTILS